MNVYIVLQGQLKRNQSHMDDNTNVNTLYNAQQRRTSLREQLVLHTSLHVFLLSTLEDNNSLRKHAQIINTYYCRTPVMTGFRHITSLFKWSRRIRNLDKQQKQDKQTKTNKRHKTNS